MITREAEAAALSALLEAPPKGMGWSAIAAHVSSEDSAQVVLDESDDALF